MASDLIVALGRATVGAATLFGANHYARTDRRQRLRQLAGGNHPPDEPVRTSYLRLPQARQTYTVLGQQPDGAWGLTHGINENQVAVGVTGWHSRLSGVGGGLTGTDLVRLALERSHSALHALDVLTDLIGRHGQCPEPGAGRGEPSDNIFLVADRQEAFVLEGAGRHWAVLECREVRAVTDVALVRQDWQRIAPGLAALAIENGWWNGDGCKIDFAGCLDAQAPSHGPARRRWGRMTLALEQQNGAIDGPFLRRLLHGHHEGATASASRPTPAPLAGSFTATLSDPEDLALAWCAFGVPRAAVYFPVWLDGELPAAFGEIGADGIDVWQETQELRAAGADDPGLADRLERLQATFEADVESFLPQLRQCKRQGDHTRLHNQATAMMQKHIALFARECRRQRAPAAAEPVARAEEEFVSYIS